jgi:predicted nucleic acid-binding protein
LIAYPDTSFLCALYRRQDNSERALAYRQIMPEPLCVTRLVLWEFRQSVRFQAFRHSQNRHVGFPLREAERMIVKLTEHMESGIVKMTHCDLVSILVTGERISKSRTFTGGHRSFDILHLATAIVLDAKEFLSFDANQNQLAAAEGLATPLAAE